jgi:hypothetical protein
MRSGMGTNFGLPWSVVSLTKVAIACLAGPSFHEGSGSSDPAAVLARRWKGAMMTRPEALPNSKAPPGG